MFTGLKLPSYKEESRHEKIENLPFPEEVVLYSHQHIGAPSKITVKKGDTVVRGQLIAHCEGSCSANLHSSIGGKVAGIEKTATPGNILCDAVVIKKEGDQTIKLLEPLKDVTPGNIIERVKSAGIVGMGGAGFPAHIKLNPPRKIAVSFLNGCECEPYLTADETVMIEEARKVIEGFDLVTRTVGADKGIIAIEEDKKYAIEKIRQYVSKYSGLEMFVLPKKYPQGYEKMVITSVIKSEVPSGGLPHDINASVHNVGTCLAVYEAVHEGKPLIDRIITLGGSKVQSSVNVKVAIGARYKEVLGYYKVKKTQIYKIISGGPMMGTAIDSLELPVCKTTSGILLMGHKKITEYPCSSCGKCVEVCPMRLVPQRMNRLFEAKVFSALKDEGLFDCMECGSCSYICPCNIILTHNFREAKSVLM